VAKILVVEDDAQVAKTMFEWLRAEKHLVESAGSGEDALQLLRNFQYDLVLLDWSLPGISGVEVCRRYRAAGGAAWIIFLTGKNALAEKEEGLDVGGDDYLTKPFQMRELLARIRSALRRASAHFQPELRIGDVLLSLATQTCWVRDVSAHLMPKEAALLEFLMRNPGRQFSTKKLVESVWESDSGVSEGIVRTYVRTLRQKLAALGKPDFVKTVLGSGYLIESEPNTSQSQTPQ
jgi:DNA-binding response OmpR family regulator